jgi:DNA-binding FadR family transcriptional regulator
MVDTLGVQIVSGAVRPGARLFPEELCARYGVSPSVVRESLRVLEAKGLLVARPNVGTRVRPMTDWNLLDHEIVGWLVHGPDHTHVMRELLDVRSAIEPFAARQAAQHADAGSVLALVDAATRMTAAVEARDVERFVEADLDFHAALLDGCGNRPLQQLGGVVRASLEARSELLQRPEQINRGSCRLHVEAAEAVRDRNPDAAELALRRIIAHASHAIEGASAPPRKRTG